MSKNVTLIIDGKQVTVPEGTLIVDAAKLVDIDIPVFCYHPKMEPVGMCRTCLVEIGRPVRDRATGELVLNEDGTPKLSFGPKLETACTTPVADGIVVLGTTDKVKAGREDILEFLLTSHPLDCPICDKGGECPLQNLTMGFGPGVSRFKWDEKMRLAKQYPLGDLIVLDRERCIQCGRCVRFQDEIVDDPVIGFFHRGRALEIVSYSDPGFDSYFSGNTTDICPVGALTTTDFRFRARPWELKAAASICSQCPVGCNLTFNVRREAVGGGGKWVIKRAMPRQNEWVNEIWICDKGRFGYHYTRPQHRLLQPLIRKNGELVPSSWEEAYDLVAQRLREAGDGLVTLVSGRLPNEDLFNLKQLTNSLGGKSVLYSQMAGGDLTAQVGLTGDSNFKDMGPETAILVVASDLEEEAPIWWLRVKQAADRGAKLIVANPRPTKTDRYATHQIRYPYGAEATAVLAMLNQLSAKRMDLPGAGKDLERDATLQEAAKTFSEAQNAVILFGNEATGLESSVALAQACANLLIATNHVGRVNNGLIGVWERANNQGAWDMGFRPVADLAATMKSAKALYIAGADPAEDDPSLAETADFLVVQELALTKTAKLADVVLPAMAYTEREGSYTNGERRVQRFYPAVPAVANAYPDFAITAEIGMRLGIELADLPVQIMLQIASAVPGYESITYPKLAQVVDQWPIIGRADLYYGGTGYANRQGLGVQLPNTRGASGGIELGWVQPKEIQVPYGGYLAVPITRLYDRGQTLLPSTLLEQRIPSPYVVLNPEDAKRLELYAGSTARLTINEADVLVSARIDEGVPNGVILVPRSMGITIFKPVPVQITAAEAVIE